LRCPMHDEICPSRAGVASAAVAQR